MPGNFQGIFSAATGIAFIAWHCGMLARRCGWNMAMKAFYLRYCALTKCPGKPTDMRR